MQNKGTIVRIVLVALMAYALLHFAAARAELGKKDAFFMILRTFAISFLLSFVVYTLSLLLL